MAEVTHGDPIQRARMGDQNAIGALYEQYHLPVFRYLYYRTGDLHAAEDLTAEVFIRMIRSLPGYQPRDVPFLAWLFQIARNLSIDHYRKAGSGRMVPLEETLPARNADPTHAVDRRLTSQKLAEALHTLNDDQRDVIVLRFVTGMSIGETAQALAKSEDAVKGLQRRALTALRQILSEWEILYA